MKASNLDKTQPPSSQHSTLQSNDAEQTIQTVLTMDSETEIPKDILNLTRFILCTLGIGSMLSIITLFAAPDYLELQLEYGSTQILYFITPCYILPNLMATILMVRYGYYASFQIRIVSCFILTGFCLIIIPILFLDPIINSFGSQIIFYLILTLSFMIGITSAILSTSILSFAQFFPIKYLRTLVIGQSISFILICIIRICIKLLVFGLEAGGVIYFSIAAGINILCALLFVYIYTYSDFVAYYINPYLIDKEARLTKPNNNNNNNRLSDTQRDPKSKTNASKSIRHSVAIIPSQVPIILNRISQTLQVPSIPAEIIYFSLYPNRKLLTP